MQSASLGLIPSWQFDMNPANNPQVVDMQFPDGMYQTTVQPVGPYFDSGAGLQGAALGDPIDALNQVFGSWWWQNRRLIVVGGLAALALGVFGGVAALAR